MYIEIEINGAALLNHNHIELVGRRERRSFGNFDGQMDILSLSSHFQEATEICLIIFFFLFVYRTVTKRVLRT